MNFPDLKDLKNLKELWVVILIFVEHSIVFFRYSFVFLNRYLASWKINAEKKNELFSLSFIIQSISFYCISARNSHVHILSIFQDLLLLKEIHWCCNSSKDPVSLLPINHYWNIFNHPHLLMIRQNYPLLDNTSLHGMSMYHFI